MTNDYARSSLHMECMGHRVGQEVMININVIEILLYNDASVEIIDKFGNTPISYAKNSRVINIIKSHLEKKGIYDIECKEADVDDDTHFENKLQVHTVKSPDTVHTLAEEYNMTAETIRKINNLDRSTPELKDFAHVIVLKENKEPP